MGGSVIFVWHNIMEALSASAIYLLVAGGAAYVTGIVFFIWGMSRPIYHSIWHLFVVLGLPPSLSFCT
jgi:hemolysin III